MDEVLEQGILLSIKYAQTLLDEGGRLYGQDHHQASIPFCVLSLEETYKTHYLLDLLDKNKTISKTDLDNLKNHKIKLTNHIIIIQKQWNRVSDALLKKELKKLIKLGIDPEVSDKESLFKRLEEDFLDYQNLKKLKESCFYSSWDKNKKTWFSFLKIPKQSQKKINLWIVHEAAIVLMYAYYRLELMTNKSKTQIIRNKIRKKGVKELKHESIQRNKFSKNIKNGHIEFRKYYSSVDF